MSSPLPLPTSVEQLRQLVRERDAEISVLKNRIDNGIEVSARSKVLRDVKESEEMIRNSLELQLDQARETKAALEADMVNRAKNFEATLEKLQATSTSYTGDAGSPQDLQILLQNALAKLAVQETELKKLKFQLEMEQGHVNILRHDNQMLRQMTVNMSAIAEQEEEYISNKLLKRISGLKKEKGELLVQVEQEEEYLTNTLQKKLTQLQKEKIDMENALEQEQEFIVNKLQKQLDSLRIQQAANGGTPSPLSSSIGSSAQPIVPSSPNPRKGVLSHSPSNTEFATGVGGINLGMVEMLRAENVSWRSRVAECEKEYLSKYNQCNRYKAELIELRKKLGMSVDDLAGEESIPAFMTGSGTRTPRRSASSSSQLSISSDKSSSTHPIGGLGFGLPPPALDSNRSGSSSAAMASSPSAVEHSYFPLQGVSTGGTGVTGLGGSRSRSVSNSSQHSIHRQPSTPNISSTGTNPLQPRRISGQNYAMPLPPGQ